MADTIRVGGVRVDIEGNATDLVGAVRRSSRAMDRQRRSLQKLRTSYKQTGDAARKFANRVAAAASLAAASVAVRTLTRQSVRLGTALAEASVRTGVAVQSLQLLGRVAAGDGVAVAQLHKSLTLMNRAIGYAREGVKTYADAFERVGINIAALEGATPEQIFNRIADAVRDTNNLTAATQSLSEIFGRGGAGLYNFIRGGSEALREQQREFAKLGTLTDQQAVILKGLGQVQQNALDRTQTAVARIVADNATAIAQAVAAFSDLAIAAVDRVVPAVEGISRAIVFVGRNAEAILVGYLTLKAIPLVIKGWRAIIAAIALARKGMLAFGAAALKAMAVAAAGALVANAFVALAQTAFNEKSFTENFTDNIQKAIDLVDDFVGSVFNAREEVAALGPLFDPQVQGGTLTVPSRPEFEPMPAPTVPAALEAAVVDWLDPTVIAQRTAALEANRQAVEGLTRSTAQEAQRLENEVALLGLSAQRRAEVSAAQQVATALTAREIELSGELRAAKLAEDDAARNAALAGLLNLRAIRASSRGVTEQIVADTERIAAATEKLREAEQLQNVFDTLGDAVGNFAADVVINFNSIGDAARSLARVIASQLATQFIAAPISSAISSAFAGAFSAPSVGAFGAAGPDGPAPLGAPSVGAFGAAGPDGPGSIAPPMSAAATGAEASIAGQLDASTRGASVRGAMASDRAPVGGTTITVSPTIIGSDEATVRRALADSVPDIIRAVQETVTRDAARPSAFREAFLR